MANIEPKLESKFDPIPDPPSPEEIAMSQGKVVVADLRMAVLAMIACAGHCSRLAFDLVSEGTRNADRLHVLVATASTALESAERAQRILGVGTETAK